MYLSNTSSPTPDVVKSDSFIRAKFGGSKSVSLVVSSEIPGEVLRPDVLAAMDGLAAYLKEKAPEVGKTTGFTDIIKRINQVFNADESPDGLKPSGRADRGSGTRGSGARGIRRRHGFRFWLWRSGRNGIGAHPRKASSPPRPEARSGKARRPGDGRPSEQGSLGRRLADDVHTGTDRPTFPRG